MKKYLLALFIFISPVLCFSQGALFGTFDHFSNFISSPTAIGDITFTGTIVFDISSSSAVSFTVDDANNSSVTDLIVLTHTTSGTPAAGIGVGIGIDIEDAGGTERQVNIRGLLTTVTDGAENADVVITQNSVGGIVETLRLIGSQSATTANFIRHTSATTETNGLVTVMEHVLTGGTVLTGFGAKVLYNIEENDGTIRTAASIRISWEDAGEGTNADSRMAIFMMENDIQIEVMRLATGNGQFFGSNSDNRLTIDRTGNTVELRARNILNLTSLLTDIILTAGDDVILSPTNRLEVNAPITQETFVITKVVSLTGGVDNVAKDFLTITTTDETGSADGGSYICYISLLASEGVAASGATNVASRGLEAHFTRVMASAGTGSNSAMAAIDLTAEAAEGTGNIITVTLTIVETSEFIQTIQLLVDTSGGTFDGFAEIRVVYNKFTTAPVIAGL